MNKQQELFFRVWDGSNFYYPDKLKITNCTELGKSGIAASIENCAYLEHDSVIQRSIGLKDIHNKNVYEGDVLRALGYFRTEDTKPSIGVIEWDDYGCSYKLNVYKNGNSNWDVIWMGELREVNKFEVIGNVFENPDLLLS